MVDAIGQGSLFPALRQRLHDAETELARKKSAPKPVAIEELLPRLPEMIRRRVREMKNYQPSNRSGLEPQCVRRWKPKRMCCTRQSMAAVLSRTSDWSLFKSQQGPCLKVWQRGHDLAITCHPPP